MYFISVLREILKKLEQVENNQILDEILIFLETKEQECVKSIEMMSPSYFHPSLTMKTPRIMTLLPLM